MTTQAQAARLGRLTPEMERVAADEGLHTDDLMALIARGQVVIPANPAHRSLRAAGVGTGLRTKVNANLGTSALFPQVKDELEKLQLALKAGADAVMDLSTGSAKGIESCRRAMLAASPAMLGTVPVYQAAVIAQEYRGAVVDMSAADLFDVIEAQAADGVDFMTVHVGVTGEAVDRLRRQGRITDIVSRGGALMAGWMLHNDCENPLYTEYDRLLEIAGHHDVTLSLGDGLRPGCLADATDRGQVQELIILGELVARAREAGVQVMVEGPGHVPLDQVQGNVMLEKRLCEGAPFYVLGPIVTDVAPGYDHITSAIGGALAAAAGADFLCYVTPAEHLGLPSPADVWDGIMAARIAAHAADVVKGVKGAREWDEKMARARKALDWETQIATALDPERARRYRRERNPENIKECSMCGSYCAMEMATQAFGGKGKQHLC